MLKQLRGYVGRTGRMELEGMIFQVEVKDYGLAYGHGLLTVKPKKGKGQKVVRADRLTFA